MFARLGLLLLTSCQSMMLQAEAMPRRHPFQPLSLCEDILSQAQIRVLNRLQALAPGVSRENLFFEFTRKQNHETILYPSTKLAEKLGLRLGYHMARSWAEYQNGYLRFDIEVEEQAQQKGLYTYLLAGALRQYPFTQEIGARMPYLDSQNARVFFDRFLKQIPQMTLDHFSPHRNPDVFIREYAQELRRRAFAALRATPAYNVRVKLGFAHVRKITLGLGFLDNPRSMKLDRTTLRFAVNPSEEWSEADTPIYILIPGLEHGYRLDSNGEVKFTTIEEAQDLGAYPLSLNDKASLEL